MKYQTKTFRCKKCGIEYVIETDGEAKDFGYCSECQKQKRMNKIQNLFLISAILLIGFALYLNGQERKKLFKEIKEMRGTLEYIDNRMDTLEFFRIPEKKK
jgi:hypothetical protein